MAALLASKVRAGVVIEGGAVHDLDNDPFLEFLRRLKIYFIETASLISLGIVLFLLIRHELGF